MEKDVNLGWARSNLCCPKISLIPKNFVVNLELDLLLVKQLMGKVKVALLGQDPLEFPQLSLGLDRPHLY